MKRDLNVIVAEAMSMKDDELVKYQEEGFWYFAHPYSVRDERGRQSIQGMKANFNLCNVRAGKLAWEGWKIFSPISHGHPIAMRSTYFILSPEKRYTYWMNLDMEFLSRTRFDGIILASEFMTSHGCMKELEMFEQAGLTVLLYSRIFGKGV